LQLLESLSQTALILWVAESNYGYPIVLTLHSIGMALVIGIMLVVDLRVIGLINVLSFTSLRKFFTVAWIGLAINAGSGTLLFLANYSAFLTNTAFITKIILLVIGAALTAVLSRQLQPYATSDDSSYDTAVAYPLTPRLIAALCLCLWLGAITAGRIVGYTSVPM